MNNKDVFNNNESLKINTIGNQIRMIRTWLNLTQDEFAHRLCINSRIAITKAEKAESVEDISTDTLYRLAFFLNDIYNQFKNYSDFFVDLIKSTYDTVEFELSSRASNFVPAQTNKWLNSSKTNCSVNMRKREKQLVEC